MSQKVVDIITYSSESHSVDFKRDQYPIEKHAKKHEFLKDISAMANHPSDEDKYIIIGIREKNGIASDFYNITELIDQSKYQQYIDSNIEPKIKFEYKSFNFNDCQLAYFRIFGNNDRPYLIKKTVQNSLEKNKNEFREGDGFIRVGTSTKKIKRIDFDQIYKAKYISRDRKSELIITPYWKITDDEYLRDLNLKYFDISIENTSNHSIDLDVEMTVFNGDDYKIISENTLRKELEKNTKLETNRFGISPIKLSGIITENLQLDVEEKDDYVFIRRTKLRHQKFAINIPQKAIEKDVFQQELIIIIYGSYTITAEIIIRSDDFTEGLYKKTIKLNIDN